MPTRKITTDIVVIFAVALAGRVIHAAALARTPFFLGPVIDSITYRALAERIASSGDWGGPFYQPPLYPALWALLASLHVEPGWSLSLAHCVAGAVSASLMYIVGRQIGARVDAAPRRLGLICGLAFALCGPLILYDLEYLPPAWIHLLLIAAWTITLSRRGPSSLRDCLSGLLIGTAGTGWVFSLLFLLPTVWLRFSELRRHTERLASAVLILSIAALPVAIVHRHNASAGSPSVVISWNGGINFWLGNNEHWRETWAARPGPAFASEFERPEKQGYVTPQARSSYFYRAAFADIRAHPLDAIGRTLEKLYYVWHGREIRRNQDFETLREASPLLRILQWEHGVMFPFGIIAPLALAGGWRLRGRPVARICMASAAAYSLLVACHIVATRYRLPMLVWLVPFAAYEGNYIGSSYRSISTLLPALVATVVLNLPNDFTKTLRATAVERASLRLHAWAAQANWDRAMAESDAMLRDWPQEPCAAGDRAQLLEMLGRCSEALPYLSRFLELAPDMSRAWVAKGVCYEQHGALGSARQSFQRALDLNPHGEPALREAAFFYAATGNRHEAMWLVGRMKQLGYDDQLDIDGSSLATAANRTIDLMGVP